MTPASPSCGVDDVRLPRANASARPRTTQNIIAKTLRLGRRPSWLGLGPLRGGASAARVACENQIYDTASDMTVLAGYLTEIRGPRLLEDAGTLVNAVVDATIGVRPIER